MRTSAVGLESLPVELFYEIQHETLSEFLPLTSQHIRAIFQLSHISFRCEYLLRRVVSRGAKTVSSILTKILRYPICTQDVLEQILQRLKADYPTDTARYELPRRLFRSLVPKAGHTAWNESEQPLPFLQYLFDIPGIPDSNINSYDGYALTKAVHAKYLPLVRFLLKNGAEPHLKNSLAIFVAIRQRDLTLVKLLIERDDSPYTELPVTGKRKRRKFEDRVVVNRAMLKAAVKCDARDIAEYLIQDKGLVPDMQTLHMMTS